MSLQRGGHLLKAGGTLLHNRLSIAFPGALQGVYTFASLPASSLTALPGQLGGVDDQNPNLAAFVQDTWQAAPSLTVDAGLRYDVQWLAGPPRTDTNNVAPRVGISWAPGGRETVFRASAEPDVQSHSAARPLECLAAGRHKVPDRGPPVRCRRRTGLPCSPRGRPGKLR